MDLLADVAPTEGIAEDVPIPNAPVEVSVRFMDDERRLFVHLCDRRPSNPNRSGRFRSNAGVIRAAPELDPKHAIVTREPLHVHPSIVCLDCGLHGWIRDGRWVPA